MEIVERDKAAGQLVVKSNTLIQKARYELSLQEQKVILYFISLLKPTDEDFKDYTVDLKTLCDLFDIEYQTANYNSLLDSVQALRDKSFWIYTEKKDLLFSWLHRIEIDKEEKVVRFRFDDRLKPYFLQLQQRFTSYELGCVLSFKSKYSVRLFELLKSYQYQKTLEISLQDLKRLFLIEDKYPEYRVFKVKVLDKAVREINFCKDTRIFVEYTTKRRGRFIDTIIFKIEDDDV